MVISLLGPSGIKCQVADFSLLVDPSGRKKGSLVLETSSKIEEKDFPEEGKIAGAGEYEVSGVRVRGIDLGNSDRKVLKTAYAVRFDGIRLGFLNSIKNVLSQDALDKLGEIDVLFVDTESSGLSSKEMAALVKKIEPHLLVPMTDKGAKKMLEEFGQKTNKEEKLALRAKDINKEEGIRVIWLKNS